MLSLVTISDAEKSGFANEAELEHFISIAKPNGGYILDVSTGAGQIACAIAPFVDRVMAIDSFEYMIQFARAHADRKGIKNVEFRRAPEDGMPFESNLFDGISCRGAVHWFSDVHAFLSEAYRVLKPSGWLVIEDALSLDDQTAARELDEIERMRDSYHVHFYSEKRWKRMLGSVGFRSVIFDVTPKPYHALSWLESRQRDQRNSQEVFYSIENSSGWLREYLRPFGHNETLTFHMQRMILKTFKVN